MNNSVFIVAALGVAAILWVNWYFLFAVRGSAAATATGGRQLARILVRGGYEPGVIRVKRGIPVQLEFDRQETSSCSDEVLLPAFGIRRFLPPFQKTVVELTPTEAGEFDISCGMSMLHAKLVVED